MKERTDRVQKGQQETRVEGRKTMNICKTKVTLETEEWEGGWAQCRKDRRGGSREGSLWTYVIRSQAWNRYWTFARRKVKFFIDGSHRLSRFSGAGLSVSCRKSRHWVLMVRLESHLSDLIIQFSKTFCWPASTKENGAPSWWVEFHVATQEVSRRKKAQRKIPITYITITCPSRCNAGKFVIAGLSVESTASGVSLKHICAS